MAAPAYSFIQISDVHYDPHYVAEGNEYCHNEQEFDDLVEGEKARNPKYRYGRPGSDCDSPLILIEKTVAELRQLDPDLVFWTGDSSRHDRDYKVPRHPLDIVQGIKRVAGLVNSAFRIGVVFPTVGNWDTLVQNAPSLEDYQSLFHIWSILWSEKQKLEIQITFLEGGFYSVKYSKDLVVVSLNTIEFYIDNVAGDCRKHNQQLEWLESILEEVENLNQSVIIIGHVPPLNYQGSPLYHPRCLSIFTNLIGRFSKQIISQYYGHVNRDIAYLTTKQSDDTFQIMPLTLTTLSNTKFTDYEIVGHLFTGSSIVPYFYPSFKWGMIASHGTEELFIMNHVQYYAPIDTYLKNESSPFYKESCSTKDLLMNQLSPSEWKGLSASIQHEIKESGSSNLAKYYWECSTVHWTNDLKQTFGDQNLHNQRKQPHQHRHLDGDQEISYNQSLDLDVILILMGLVFVAFFSLLTKARQEKQKEFKC